MGQRDMGTYAPPRQPIGPSVPVTEGSDALHSTEEIARAEEKIAEWREYLPEDCVKAMIQRGWHFSVQ